VTLVSESGVAARADVERLGAHADAFPGRIVADGGGGRGRGGAALVFGRVKLCGLTRAADVRAAAAAGATHAGIILVPGTPRFVEEGRAQALPRKRAAPG
jgi:indole-3-glycerol phosphate synthase/phosphoribosylanthranilate isomerase